MLSAALIFFRTNTQYISIIRETPTSSSSINKNLLFVTFLPDCAFAVRNYANRNIPDLLFKVDKLFRATS